MAAPWFLRATLASGAMAAAAFAPDAGAQVPSDLAGERAVFAEWLARSPLSPNAAIAVVAIDATGSSLPIDGPPRRLVERAGVVWIEGNGPAQRVPLGRPFALGKYRVVVNGDRGRARALVYGAVAAGTAPAYYDYDPRLVFAVSLAPPSGASARAEGHRVLLADGTEVTGTDAGTVEVGIGTKTRLRVLRLPDPSPDETTLQIYFRDASTGSGSYPAGRFVTLDPLPGGRWRLDFNRARNPFCAYNAAYPCPAPWRGNSLTGAVRAGERYKSH
ncbi:MAG: DUF1684 domain-containing protein [Gemmatimonadota bacterium]